MGALRGVGLGAEVIGAELREDLGGSHPGRTSDEQRTSYGGVGLPFQDAAAAWQVYEHAVSGLLRIFKARIISRRTARRAGGHRGDGRRVDDMAPIVFIVDGDIAVRQSLELLIKTAGWDTEPFASAEEFMSHPRGNVPCCVILDLTLPGLSGLELQQQLASRPDLPIIFFTSHTDVPMAVQAMKAGAVDFLVKPFNDAALLYVIGAAIERSRAALRHDSEMQVLRRRYSTLTPREREVMALVVSGLLNKQVGGELGISEITVKAHRGQVMRKMKADSLADLVTIARKQGELSPWYRANIDPTGAQLRRRGKDPTAAGANSLS